MNYGSLIIDCKIKTDAGNSTGQRRTVLRIKVDKNACAGHAVCAARAPDIFLLNDEGYLDSDGQVVPPEWHDLARVAAASCPEQAIKLIEQGDGSTAC